VNTQSDQIKGHAKSVAGIVTGNQDLQAEGDAETRTADASARIDDAKDKAVEVIDRVTDTIDDLADKAKNKIHTP
jgi:uncharacterized protein YjbJ (UPF0337 family)